jgi:hypothetical protein
VIAAAAVCLLLAESYFVEVGRLGSELEARRAAGELCPIPRSCAAIAVGEIVFVGPYVSAAEAVATAVHCAHARPHAALGLPCDRVAVAREASPGAPLEVVPPPVSWNAVVVITRAYGFELPEAVFPQASERTVELGRNARVLALETREICESSDCVSWTLVLAPAEEHRLLATWLPSLSMLRDADSVADGRRGTRVGLRRVGRTAVGAEYETVVLRQGQPPVRVAFSATRAVEPLSLAAEARGFAVLDARGAPLRKVTLREARKSKARARRAQAKKQRARR